MPESEATRLARERMLRDEDVYRLRELVDEADVLRAQYAGLSRRMQRLYAVSLVLAGALGASAVGLAWAVRRVERW